MDLAEVFAGIDAALATIPDIRHYDFEPSNPSPPCAFPLLPESIPLRADFSGNVDLTVQVRVLVPWTTDRGALALLQPYLSTSGATSIQAALEADRTLGGACDDINVGSVAQLGRVSYGTTEYLGADFIVEILA